jgi:hypothetical protein
MSEDIVAEVPRRAPASGWNPDLDLPRWTPPRGWSGEGEVFAAGFLHRDRWDDVLAGAGFAAGGFMDDLPAGPLLAALISEATAATEFMPATVTATAPATPAARADRRSAAGGRTTPAATAPPLDLDPTARASVTPTSAAATTADPSTVAGGHTMPPVTTPPVDPHATVRASGARPATAAAATASPVASTARHGGDSYATLGESELIGVLCAWRRLASWAAAGQAAAIAELSRRRHARARELNDAHLSEHVGDEIAAALTLTGQAAANCHGDALALVRLPEVHASLAEGRIDWPKACVFGRELHDVPGQDAPGLAAQVLPDAPSLTTAQIRGRLRRLVLACDPEAASQRKADAARETEVVVWTESSGNASLAGRELPESDVLAADRRLTALARWLSERGATGSVSQLRSAAFLTLLRGVAIESLLPPGAPPAADGADATAPAQPAVSGTIHLTMPLSAWAGLSDAAGEVAGYGPADASTCRDLADLMSQAGATRWQLSLVSPAGQAIATASARAGQPAPPGADALTWAAALARELTFLATGACRHERAEGRYQPSGRLRGLVKFRQPECSFPGCRRPAARCDLDHTTPYDQGGLTCECNLATLCRQHHRAKQAPGWRLTQEQPGVMCWELPSGRQYRAAAHSYPM